MPTEESVNSFCHGSEWLHHPYKVVDLQMPVPSCKERCVKGETSRWTELVIDQAAVWSSQPRHSSRSPCSRARLGRFVCVLPRPAQQPPTCCCYRWMRSQHHTVQPPCWMLESRTGSICLLAEWPGIVHMKSLLLLLYSGGRNIIILMLSF